MKVVLDTKKGSAYDDAIASHYHFPTRYLKAMSAAVGDWAIFRRPRDGGDGIAYFGVGRIIRITPDVDKAGFHYAFISDYLPFPSEVAWQPNGIYAEKALRGLSEVSQIGVYLRGRSVRPLEDVDFVSLVDEGLREIDDPSNSKKWWDDKCPNVTVYGTCVEERERKLQDRAVRDASFRKNICDAYEDRCAVTRLRIINGGGRAEVHAAHIQPVSKNGPDLVQNGLALSSTAHWLFDRHLISIDQEYRLLVADNRIPSEFRNLLAPARKRLHLPQDERLYPAQTFLSHHREKFGGFN